MKIPIVDKNDNIMGYKERDEVTNDDIRRIIHVWVFNENKDFLIAKRQKNKKISPDKWGPSVAGSIEKGESYESNAKKEVEEEIGIKNVFLKPYKKLYYENNNGKRFCTIFIAFVNLGKDNLLLQEEEVSEVKWVSLEELATWYKKSPEDFIPSMGQTINLIREYRNEDKN